MSSFPADMARTTPNKAVEWGDLKVILAVCRAGSLSGAARILHQNHSTVFRRINAIEDRTGVRFFERLPHGYEMTEAGHTVLEYAERIEAEVDALSREVLGQDLEMRGKVRMTAPEGFAICHAPRLLADFRREHPAVSVEMVGARPALDLGRREADIAVRATPKPPDSAMGRKVCDFRFAIYAAPAYLDRSGERPIQDHDWCWISDVTGWLMPLFWKKKGDGEQRTVFSSASALAVQNAGAEGMGLFGMSCYMGDADPRVVRVTDPLEDLTMGLWILTHSDLRRTARVKALMAFLHDKLSRDADLFEGRRVTTEPRIQFVPPFF